MTLSAAIETNLRGVNSILHSLLEGVTHDEWTTRPAPGVNAVGFNAWHVPGIQDWAVRTFIQARLPLRADPEWVARGACPSLLDFSMTAADADAIARAATPDTVLAYSDAVLEQTIAFMAALAPEDYERPSGNPAHLDLDPAFRTPGYLEEIDGMEAYPIWRLLNGSCGAHARGHLGEIEATLNILRAR